MEPNDSTHIYGIIDPQTRTIIYVGRSVDPEHRLQDHIRFGRRGIGQPLAVRIGSILDVGLTPEVVILETVSKEVAHHAEERWIAAFRDTGNLCNQRDVCAIPRDAEGPRRPVPPPPLRPYKPRGPRLQPSAMHPEEMTAFRETRGWSKGELARRLGVTAGAVTRWENGERAIARPTAQLIRSW